VTWADYNTTCENAAPPGLSQSFFISEEFDYWYFATVMWGSGLEAWIEG